MRDLVINLPSGQQRPAKNLEEDTVVAVLNTIHEIVTDSSENARSLVMAQAIDKLVAIHRTRYRITPPTRCRILSPDWTEFFFFYSIIGDGLKETPRKKRLNVRESRSDSSSLIPNAPFLFCSFHDPTVRCVSVP